MAQQNNPFYVDPFGGYGQSIVQGLSGLGAVLGDRQRLKREEEEKKQILAEAQEVFASNDPNRIAEFSLRAPQFAEQVSQAVKFKNDATKQNMTDSMRRILAGEDPEQVIIERAQMVQEQGGDPIDTLQELDVYRQDPQGYAQQVARSYALLDPQGYTAFRQAMAPTPGEKFTGAYGNLALAMFGTNDSSRMTSQMLQQLDEEARRRQLERPPSTTVNINPEQKQFSNEQDLRKEVKADPTIKNFKDVQFAYDQVSTALKKPSAANDLTAATKFMKILDPGSVVRESELGLAMEATGKLDLAMNYFNRLQTGEKLTPSQRQDFLQAATALYEAASSRAKPVIQQYSQIARDSGLNADRVIDKDLQSILRNPAMANLPPALQGFSESAIADAAKQEGVSIEEFIQIMSQ